jgi:2-polyprenyl-3-methyl-5-hydroxy-6-metoxy-1,4-benzoquinol methylase
VIKDYRERLYDGYFSSHILQDTAKLLGTRAPYLKRIVNCYFPHEKSARILELGCGYGALVKFALDAGYTQVEGIDISQEQVDVAKQLGINGVRKNGLAEALNSQEDGSLDMVVSFDVIEHLSKSELLNIADEVNRVLSKKGRWLLHMPNAASPFFGRIRYGDFTHEQAFTKGSLSQALRVAGFSKINCYEESPVIHGFKSAVRWVIWKVVRTVYKVILAAETGDGNEIFSQNFLAVASK